MLEDQFVSGIELDPGLAVDAVGVEVGAELTLGPGSVASGLS
jgi:hypothetical protein